MKLTLKALGAVAQRLSTQAAGAGIFLTAASTQINGVLAQFGTHIPDKLQGEITGTALALTIPAMLIAGTIPQKSVGTYNPKTHDLVAKAPDQGAPQ